MSLVEATRNMTAALSALEAAAPPVPKRPLFLSYAHPDRALMTTLRDRLTLDGYDCWWDGRIEPGANFRKHIVEALDRAVAVIVLWTASSHYSEWVQWEAARGLRQQKLIPVACPSLDLGEIMPPFSGLNTLPLGNDALLLDALRRCPSPRS